MSLKITHKYSTAAGTPPASGDIDVGEVAINAADAELYVKDDAGNIRKFQNTTTGTADGVQFTQAGTGAVQRTVKSKLQDVVSVKDFGAVGDGVTDDTAAIQAAIDAHFSIYFPAGVYRLNGTLTLRSGTSLQGPGITNANVDTSGDLGGAKLVFYGTGSTCFASDSLTGISRLGICGITVMGHDNPGRDWIFDFPSLNESNFSFVAASNRSADGGVLRVTDGGEPAWVNYFTNCEFGVLDASTQYVVDAIFTDSRIVGSYFTGGKGFYYHGFGGLLISSCHLDRTNSGGAGLVLKKRTPDHSPTHQTTVIGCYFDENDEAGIILDATGSTSDTQWQAVISGCCFRNRNTVTADVKFVQPTGQLSYGGCLVGCSMTSGVPAFTVDPDWTRVVISNLVVPGADAFAYQEVSIVPGLGTEDGGTPSYKLRTTGLTNGSPNTAAFGIDGPAYNGVAYIDTGKAGVAADTPLEFRINSSAKAKVDATGDFEITSGRLKCSNAQSQSTVGVPGAAAGLPTNPTGYLRIVVGGIQKVIPYYEA